MVKLKVHCMRSKSRYLSSVHAFSFSRRVILSCNASKTPDLVYKYYNAGPDTENETVVKFFENCKRDMGFLLTTYVGISKEDADNLANMSEGQIHVLVEEAYNGKSTK